MKPTLASTFAVSLSLSLSLFAAFTVCGAVAACGAAPVPPAQGAPVDSAAATPPSVAPSSAPSAPAADAPPTPPARPLDLTSSCPHDMHVYYGDTPGDGKGQAATIATGAAVPVPRGADGTVVVWVTDDKGAGLASVHVTKNMRHIRIDATCSKIDADSKR
jgi:hypothetical protein